MFENSIINSSIEDKHTQYIIGAFWRQNETHGTEGAYTYSDLNHSYELCTQLTFKTYLLLLVILSSNMSS